MKKLKTCCCGQELQDEKWKKKIYNRVSLVTSKCHIAARTAEAIVSTDSEEDGVKMLAARRVYKKDLGMLRGPLKGHWKAGHIGSAYRDSFIRRALCLVWRIANAKKSRSGNEIIINNALFDGVLRRAAQACKPV